VVTLKSPKDIKILKEGGSRLARILNEVSKEIKPGITGGQLERLTKSLILNAGGRPSFLNYQPDFSNKPFPTSLCLSINEVIVHGIPTDEIIIKEGDIVSLDLGLEYKKLFTDMALTIAVGKVDSCYKKLIRTTKIALNKAIEIATEGHTLGDIGYTINSYVKSQGFRVIKNLVGHGVGYKVHEEPEILNYGEPHTGLKLKRGMVLAIEPMVTFKSEEAIQGPDGSFITADGLAAAHFEHTIVVMPKKALILTKI